MSRMTDALARLMPQKAMNDLVTKASKAHRLVAVEQLGQPVWTPRDYAAFAREGFMQNAIVYRSVRMVAEAAASIPLLLYEGAREVESHPFIDLMSRPSLDHTSADFFESWYGYLLVAGNAYVEAVGVDGVLRELHALRPDRMRVVPGSNGWPDGYEYGIDGRAIRLQGEAVDGVRSVLHVRLFHPANDHYGMSPIEAAATAIDVHNQAAKWNKALLDNSARPSGALVYAAREGQLTEEQFQRLKDELEVGFQGVHRAGRPMLLEGGLDWKQLSLSPKDMDFVEAKNGAAREIALALGVPPMLLGIPGDNTYSNYQEASRTFWRQTVLPLVTRTAKAMSAWLSPAWGGGLELRPDLDQIEALS
ncbi:MAG: phage portal protein, partial [Hyphomicrobiaceae bacterium]